MKRKLEDTDISEYSANKMTKTSIDIAKIVEYDKYILEKRLQLV